jgi:hypothetical protein
MCYNPLRKKNINIGPFALTRHHHQGRYRYRTVMQVPYPNGHLFPLALGGTVATKHTVQVHIQHDSGLDSSLKFKIDPPAPRYFIHISIWAKDAPMGPTCQRSSAQTGYFFCARSPSGTNGIFRAI